jgi:hypothetical protein
MGHDGPARGGAASSARGPLRRAPSGRGHPRERTWARERTHGGPATGGAREGRLCRAGRLQVAEWLARCLAAGLSASRPVTPTRCCTSCSLPGPTAACSRVNPAAGVRLPCSWPLEMLFLAGRCRAPRPAHCPRMTSVWEQRGLAPGITQPGSSLCADGADGDQGSRLVASCRPGRWVLLHGSSRA